MTDKRKPMWKPEERLSLHGIDEQGKKRIREITVQLVSGMVRRGELNPEDESALKRAVGTCAVTARAAYLAALEFLAG